jgi:hypothetical protein
MSTLAKPDYHRLGQLLRLMLSTTSEGEALAARHAFLRDVAAQGLSLHDIGDRVERGAPESTPPEAKPATARVQPPRDVAWEAACQLVDAIEDAAWPDVADWLVEQDQGWFAAHPPRHLLLPYQLTFVHHMQEETRTVRPTQRQCAWLLCLIDAVNRRDRALSDDRRCALDRLYQRIGDDLDALLKAVGLKVAA